MNLRNNVSLDLLWKVAALVFAAGMLYSNTKASGEQTRKDLESTRQQIERRVDRIEAYLDAMRRNGL